MHQRSKPLDAKYSGRMMNLRDKDSSTELEEYDPRWDKVYEQVCRLLENLIRNIVPSDKDNRRRSDAAEIFTAILDITKDWAKANMEKPCVEVEKLKAEITKLYAESEETFAKAEAIRLENVLKRLEIARRTLQFAKTIALVRNKQKQSYELDKAQHASGDNGLSA